MKNTKRKEIKEGMRNAVDNITSSPIFLFGVSIATGLAIGSVWTLAGHKKALETLAKEVKSLKKRYIISFAIKKNCVL